MIKLNRIKYFRTGSNFQIFKLVQTFSIVIFFEPDQYLNPFQILINSNQKSRQGHFMKTQTINNKHKATEK